MSGGVLAVDIGGTGSRARWTAPGASPRLAHGPRVGVATSGVAVLPVLDAVVAELGLGPGDVTAVAFGVAGWSLLAPELDGLVADLRTRFGDVPAAAASDAVTSAIGALGGGAGAVVLAGTGATALGLGSDTWHRVDGWGHLLGDDGAGVWLGIQGLRAALEQHDGRRVDAGPLLAAAVERFGPPETWPRQLYTRDDRAGVLASFVPDLTDAAEDGCPVARGLLANAGRRLARTLAAAVHPDVAPRASYTGGLFRIGPLLERPMLDELGRLRPDVQVVPARGTALDGADWLAHQAQRRTLRERPPMLRVW